MMKTITKFMTLCAIVVCSVTASAQTTISPEATIIHAGDQADVVKYVENATSWRTNYCGTSSGALKDVLTAYGYSYALIAKFNASTALEAKILKSAKLKYTSCCTVNGKNSNINVYKMNGESWDASTATWNIVNKAENFGHFDASLSKVNHNSTPKAVEIDVTNILNNDADKTIAFVIFTETGREQEISDFKLEIDAVDASLVVEYNVKYLCDSKEIKSITYNDLPDNSISISDEDKAPFFVEDQKYIYVSDDSEGKIIASDNSTVVTVTCRKAAIYSYTLKDSNGSTITTVSDFEGESLVVPYCMYIVNENDVLCSTPATSQEYVKYVTLTSEAMEETLTYTETATSNIAFYSEVENISGMTAFTSGNARSRCSNAAMGYPGDADVVVTTLPAGKYTITASMFTPSSAGGELTLSAGTDMIVFTGNASQNATVVTSEEIDIAKDTEIIALKGGSKNCGIDYIYIVRTGESTAVESIKAEQPADDNYYDLSGRKVANPVKGNIYINGGKLIRY